jgi:hypothetical protein
MSNWFRFYDDAVNDPKIIDLPDDLFRAWVNCLCIAAKNDGVLPEMKHVALVLRVKPTKAAALVTRLVAVGLMDNHSGLFTPHNWQGRQFKPDDSGPRVKKHREKLRNAKGNGECNVTGVGLGNALEGEEKKIEGEQSRADASAPMDEDLKKREAGLKAGVGAHFASRGQPVPKNLDRCLLWLTQGYAAGTVLGAVEAVLKRGKPVSTLEYFDGAVRDAHAKAAPENLQVVVTKKYFVEVGTTAWTCWDQENRAKGGRGYPVTQYKIENTVKDGWWFESEYPPGYDEATGEKLAPANEENAA